MTNVRNRFRPWVSGIITSSVRSFHRKGRPLFSTRTPVARPSAWAPLKPASLFTSALMSPLFLSFSLPQLRSLSLSLSLTESSSRNSSDPSVSEAKRSEKSHNPTKQSSKHLRSAGLRHGSSPGFQVPATLTAKAFVS
ncbi:LOW QUALITY PROTEIN: hypothetical protein TorRG33x02_111750 [Trema orientale]|uniref:Uncharacterized protein n=1 Tax=Trema orientale TaxID=63057 RepID=A0A2P5F528_TREOI|nr:LOW QUALITY PROTEIN: hypothetical protein TorRG33x02_111750 [Trema orientale]